MLFILRSVVSHIDLCDLKVLKLHPEIWGIWVVQKNREMLE